MGTLDGKSRWLEARIASSLRPRNEELRNMFTNEDNRRALHEFTQNEDVRRLFVYINPGPSREIIVSLQPPQNLASKSVFFLKTNSGIKLTNENMDEEVMYVDCSSQPLEHLNLLTREVFLPFLCSNQTLADASGANADKLMDVLHRLMATVEVSQGQIEGKLVLSLPSVEVLAEAAANPNRRASVLHVLETTVIGWIKQIKIVLRHEPLAELHSKFGPEPGPLDEMTMWESQLARLQSLNQQLDTPIAKDILLNLEQANSQYAHSFLQVRKDINKAVTETQKILRFLHTMSTWFEDLHRAMEPQPMITTMKPLMTALNLVWTHSKYYHQMDRFHNLLRLISNEVVHRAQAMVGEDILREPLQSYSKLKDALRVCAAFRGTYLDYKDRADDVNARTIAENEEKHHNQADGTLFKARLYGPNAYVPRFGLRHSDTTASNSSLGEDEIWTDSPWPPRNASCFNLLNSFMERCNDVLELVETTRHFRLLAGAADVGGAGSMSLDAMVKEIHKKYQIAMDKFFSVVDNILNIDGSQTFEKAFFTFRTVVKMLEKQLAEILRQAFQQCHTLGAQLRLLEVFEGISSRELVQLHLKDKDDMLVESYTLELECVRNMFQQQRRRTPLHYNMPPIVSRLLWVHALKERIKCPMEKMRKVSPHSLEGERGWQMRDTYDDILKDLNDFETALIGDWKESLTSELSTRLKQPLLIAEEYDEELEIRPQAVHVNLDPKLLLLMKEVHYLHREPFSIKLPESAKELIRNTDSLQLRVTATRLETIVSKYNTVLKTITDYERPLFERKLDKVDQLFDQGLNQFTWKMKESVDFIESAMSVVCLDVHQNLDIVQSNCHEVAEITISWSTGTLDIFRARDPIKSYSIEELLAMQKALNEEHENIVIPSGMKIHNLVQKSFEAVEISQASPAWRDYVDYMDAIVLDGLKQSTLTSLKSMLNTLVISNTTRASNTVPILTLRLELVENRVAFTPPLDQLSSVVSVQEIVSQWLKDFLDRGKLVKMLGPKVYCLKLQGSYQDYITVDEEVQRLLAHINKLVEENSEECKNLYSLFREFSFLWLQDVNQSFEEFLHGKLPLHLRQEDGQCDERTGASQSPVQKGNLGGFSEPDMAERSFLTPKQGQEMEESSVPTLDEFDQEIDIYRNARDEISSLSDYKDVGWLRVDVRPIKQVLTTYASKWMWTFTKYLSDQVTSMLQNLDKFLKRTEPEIESITGDERDTASFMKMMRLFNEVSAQQAEMDGKFNAMNRTVQLLKKYGQSLSLRTEGLFMAAPSRWSNLKTKVSLAKQRLGPRIQEESASITQDLESFGDRVLELSKDLENSDVYNRDCGIDAAWTIIDKFIQRLTILENEAQDLIELQELLEASVVNFDLLPECRHDLNNLKQMWETYRVIDEQQVTWKRQRWQKMDTKFLKEETNKQLDIVRALPEDAFTWDVYMGLHESITTIQACLPLIDDLSNPAMRTRHWKQLVRVTGGALTIDNDTLKRMTLGELLGLGLQKHGDDVRAIVQRAVKDLAIEKSLKTYEEVWLSKVFEMREHVLHKPDNLDVTGDNQSEVSQSQESSHAPGVLGTRSQVRATSRVSNQSSHSRNKRGSVASLPASLLNLGEEEGPLALLHNTGPIFEELESHQMSLQAMQSSSAAGSFLDEVVKWQKRLQTIEAVLTMWLEVQEKWMELEDVYSGPDVRIALPQETSTFAQVNRDFSLLMRASEKNPNVLQCCSRKNILPILEHMNHNLKICHKALLKHIERKRQIFPRFYFLSMEDVLHIVCNGYDLNSVNVYINKLFENIGGLVFEELDQSEKCNFQITGVASYLGERLDFRQPVLCEGQIETWLGSLVQALKAALQFQMSTAMGVEKPPAKPIIYQPVTTIRKHQPVTKGVKGLDKKNKEKGSSRASSRQAVSRQGTRSENTQKLPSVAQQSPAEQSSEQSPHSWTLDHVSEVTYLATQVQLTQLIQEALSGLEAGNRDAMQAPLEKINSSIKATTQLLKGLEDEKDTQAKRRKDQDADGDRAMEDLESSQTTIGRQTSFRGSGFDLTNEGTHTPILEERSMSTVDKLDNSGRRDTLMVTPQLHPSTVTSQREGLDAEDAHSPGKLKLLLFPGQIQKLSSLLALLSHLRDMVHRLLASPHIHKPSDSFHWKAQLLYTFNSDNRNVNIQCHQSQFEYGWEYQGSGYREVITPDTERVFVGMTQAIKSHMGSLCVGPVESGHFELVHELSRSLGQPLYAFNCGPKMDHIMLHDIFRGLASSGSWICFSGLDRLSPAVLSVLAALLSTVMDGLRQGKTGIHLESEDVQLTHTGACFALVDSAIPLQPYDPDKLLLFHSTLSHLPETILNQFRTVSVLHPDLQLTVQVLLLSQGFEYGEDLAQKTMQLYEMCKNLLGTNTFIRDRAKLGSGHERVSHGWSLQTMKYMVAEAGAQLEQSLTESQVPHDVYSKLAVLHQEYGDSDGDKESPQPLGPPSKARLEENALVIAIRNTFMPRLQNRDASIFASLLVDLWPDTDVPLDVVAQPDSAETETFAALNAKYSVKSPKSSISHRSLRESLNLNTPVVRMSSVLTATMVGVSHMNVGSRDTLVDMTDAIAVATNELSLLPGAAFQARVLQLSQMNVSHQTVFVVGPAGCGKSECIKAFAVAERERGKTINIQSVYTKALESQELMGYLNPVSKEWKDGLMASLLRKFCIQPVGGNADLASKPVIKMLQLDGDVDPGQMDLLQSVFLNDGMVVLGNSERIALTENIRFIWEMESLSSMSPSVLASVGVLHMSTSDVGWKLMLMQWLQRRPEADRELIMGLCDVYIPPVVAYLDQCTTPPMFGASRACSLPQYKRVIGHSWENMISTFCTVLETLVAPYMDLSDVEYERYFNLACIWAFGGTLAVEHRESFSQWWREQFDQYVDYPEEGTVFDYVIDNENHMFTRWTELLPMYTAPPHLGIPADAFVHTVNNEQIAQLLGLLSDVGKPVLLVGENGCGKTCIVNERIRTVCSGEVAEVLALTIPANRFTNASLLYQRLDERLEWKHGKTFVPKGNKRLMCLVDDLNLAQVDEFGFQTAPEMIRQHIDDGGFYDPTNHTWRYVKNVTYVSTVNPNTTASVPKLSKRLLRHFAIFGVPYPGNEELQTIFTILLTSSFVASDPPGSVSMPSTAGRFLGMHDDKVHNIMKVVEAALKLVVHLVVKVTVELQDRLRGMFLPTAQRCHYIFTMKDLSTIFRNVCLSLSRGCSISRLLSIWQHECHWVYGRRMVSEVDYRRFRQAFITAVKKEFNDEDQIQMLIQPKQPLFSNLIEQDGGVVTAGRPQSRPLESCGEDVDTTDLYKPSSSWEDIKLLMEKGVEEYNKVHPRIRLALYKSVIEEVCRISRTMASPHEVAHTVLVSEGCAGRGSTLVQLSAHLAGFSVVRINPSAMASAMEYKIEQFKTDLVSGYTRAGVKGERVLLLLQEEELLEEDFLVYLIEFIISGNISYLFTYENQTTIINSIRTEVTQAGLTYTREVAWDFFLRTVRNNFRICLIVGSGGERFQRRCRQYPAFTKSVNFIWLPHWSKLQLVDHAMYHLNGVEWLSPIQRENIAHMLASMHIVLRQQDGQEKTSGEYRHVNNSTYEKFIERFISLARARHTEVEEIHQAVTFSLDGISREDDIATKLRKQLEHEMIVLEERKAGTIKILSQIGQDTAITEQQVKVVKAQMDKIARLKKLLPEYQVAHERAVYKAIAIVADTKKVVQNINVDMLAELRSMQKPILDIEDLMAAIIMLLKSPTADLTWQKGAKRQMANLERFIEELMSFDDEQLPESTLNLVEPYLKKPSFDPETIERKTSNTACGSLCRWVIGVVRYHRMMISKVKPLHQKVDETTQAVDDAEHKMATLENKRKVLEVRLTDLARGFEEATIDKNDQEEKTLNMSKMLETAAELRRILKGERMRSQQIFDSHERRLVSIPGGCAMASAFVTYLGPYHHSFRRMMLTVHWPNCLRERGTPLVIDSIDGLKGRVIDWSIEGLRTASGASSVYDIDYMSVLEEERACAEATEEAQQPANTDGKEERVEEEEKPQMDVQTEAGATPAPGADTEPGKESSEVSDHPRAGSESGLLEAPLDKIQEEGTEDGSVSQAPTDSSSPMITTLQYNQYIRSLVKLLVGEKTLDTWITQDFGPRQMENAAMLCSSWQRPPMLIDPNGDGIRWLTVLHHSTRNSKLVILDMEHSTVNTISSRHHVYAEIRSFFSDNAIISHVQSFSLRSRRNPLLILDSFIQGAEVVMYLAKTLHLKLDLRYTEEIADQSKNKTDPHILMTVEKAILRGKHLLLKNCEEEIDNVISPLIHHSTTTEEHEEHGEPRMIRFCERRVLCHPSFRLYMSTTLAKPRFNPEIASTTSLINYGVSHDTLIEDILTRAFALICPALYQERRLALKNIQLQRSTLFRIAEMTKNKVMSMDQNKLLSQGGHELQLITDIRNTKVDIATRLTETRLILQELEILRDELFPLARRAAVLYAILRSMVCVHKEYQFSLKYFMSLFDEAIGGELPTNFTEFLEMAHITEEISDDSTTDIPDDVRPQSAVSHAPTANKEGSSVERGSYEEDFEESSTVRQDKQDGQEITDESASTEAAQGLLAASESLELTTVDIPDMATLPSSGIEYTSMSANQIKQLSDKLTALVFQRVRQCLYEEDSLLFATMMCLNMQAEAGQSFTEEEMSLLLQGDDIFCGRASRILMQISCREVMARNPGLGMQLSLLDFDCEADPPQWLHTEKWEDMLAVSVLPGALDSLCAKIATNSEAWEAWYKSPQPECEPIPQPQSASGHDQTTGDGSDRDNHMASPDLGNLSDFHQLLIIRMLRPDRLPAAMLRYVNKHLHLNLTERPIFRMSDVQTDAAQHLGVLVLLPPSPTHPKCHPATRFGLLQPPVEVLKSMAQSSITTVQTVKIEDGCELSLGEAIDSAEKNDGWLIIENLHLATEKIFTDLKYQLLRVGKSRDVMDAEKRKSCKFCIFVTTEPCEAIPLFLLQNLHQLAWDKFSSSSSSLKTHEPNVSNELLHPNLCAYSYPPSCLHNAIVSSLKQVPEEVWNLVRDASQFAKSVVFGVAVIQGVLGARQLFGAAGLSQFYPFTSVQITHAINTVLSADQDDSNGSETKVDMICFLISKIVFGNVMMSDSDQRYVTALVQHVLTQLRLSSSGTLTLGSTVIPTPPANVDPADYSTWYNEQTAEHRDSLQALSVHSSVEKEANGASSTEFVRHLDHMFETQNLEAGDIVTDIMTKSVSIKGLTSSLDICVEQLPPLLELGQVPSLVCQDYDFPYHHPSVLSVASMSSTLMPESIGYVLLQECLWFNSILCHIRQQIQDMQEIILAGPEAFSARLLPTVYSLQEEHIPISWTHPNCQPCTHSLLSWLKDLRQRYDQLNTWLNHGMVPTFRPDRSVENTAIAHGSLHKVWLGGLVNPQALFTALRQEKAYVAKCSVDQVRFGFEVTDSADLDSVSQLQEGGIFVENLHLVAASFDSERSCLEEARSSVHTLKMVYIWPMTEDENQTSRSEEREDNNHTYHCPVYVNKSRQLEVLTLPLPCEGDPRRWILSSTAIILDLGLPEDGCKKSRSYLMLQKLPANTGLESMPGTARTSDLVDEDTYGFRNYKEGAASKASGTQLSEQSQLSYKPMTPKALPLPSGLGLTREQPLIEETHLHKEPSESQKGEGSQYGSSQASLKKATSRPELREDNLGSVHESSSHNLTAEAGLRDNYDQTAEEGFSPTKTPSPKPPSEPKSASASRRPSFMRRRSQQGSQGSLVDRHSPDGQIQDSQQNTGQAGNVEDCGSQSSAVSGKQGQYDLQPTEAPPGGQELNDNVSAASGTQGQYNLQAGLHQNGSDSKDDKGKALPKQQPGKPNNTMQELEDDEELFGDLPSYQPTMDKQLRQSGLI